MSYEVPERPRAERRALRLPIRLRVEASVAYGQTVNVSAKGLLMIAPGSIPVVLVDMNGHSYIGRLVRATPIAGERTAYAIQLNETRDPDDRPAA